MIAMRLQPHTSLAPQAVTHIEVMASRSAQGLMLQYWVTADLSKLRIPSRRLAVQRDELWRHTCAELFVALPGHDDYFEFNFSPAGEWAVYQFDAYRQGMRPVMVTMPIIVCEASDHTLRIDVKVQLPEALHAAPLQAGVSMVIEQTSGEHSYWALMHCAQRPDFHSRDSFVLTL